MLLQTTFTRLSRLNGIQVLNESYLTSSKNVREIASFDFQKRWREYQLVLAIILVIFSKMLLYIFLQFFHR